jgi:hypothetical protein
MKDSKPVKTKKEKKNTTSETFTHHKPFYKCIGFNSLESVVLAQDIDRWLADIQFAQPTFKLHSVLSTGTRTITHITIIYSL